GEEVDVFDRKAVRRRFQNGANASRCSRIVGGYFVQRRRKRLVALVRVRRRWNVGLCVVRHGSAPISGPPSFAGLTCKVSRRRRGSGGGRRSRCEGIARRRS